MRIKYSLLLLIIFIGFSTSAQKTDKEKQMEKENQVKKEQADAKKEQSDKEYNKKNNFMYPPTKVQGNVYVYSAKGGNIGLSIGDDGIFMIDDQFAESTEIILDQIKKISDKPVEFLVNTHFHPDHTGGNANMAKNGAVIIAQENVLERLMGSPKENMSKSLEDKKAKLERGTNRLDPKALPTITFKEDLTFYYNGEKIMLFHVHNAHTDGDAMIYFTESNVLHTGDAFVNGQYPFIDVDNGGSIGGYAESLEKVKMLINDDTKIIPGHGAIATYKDVQETSTMITSLYNKVKFLYGTNVPEAEIVNDKQLTAKYDAKGYGKDFITAKQFLQVFYNVVDAELGPEKMEQEKKRQEILLLMKRKQAEKDNYKEKNKE